MLHDASLRIAEVPFDPAEAVLDLGNPRRLVVVKARVVDALHLSRVFVLGPGRDRWLERGIGPPDVFAPRLDAIRAVISAVVPVAIREARRGAVLDEQMARVCASVREAFGVGRAREVARLVVFVAHDAHPGTQRWIEGDRDFEEASVLIGANVILAPCRVDDAREHATRVAGCGDRVAIAIDERCRQVCPISDVGPEPHSRQARPLQVVASRVDSEREPDRVLDLLAGL